MRLTRVGNTFSGYYSNGGTTWTQLSTVTMALPSTVYVGLAASAHNDDSPTSTTTVQFRDITSS